LSLLLSDAVEFALRNDLPMVNQDVFAMVLKSYRSVPDRDNIFMVHTDDLASQEVRARKKAIKPLKPAA